MMIPEEFPIFLIRVVITKKFYQSYNIIITSTNIIPDIIHFFRKFIEKFGYESSIFIRANRFGSL